MTSYLPRSFALAALALGLFCFAPGFRSRAEDKKTEPAPKFSAAQVSFYEKEVLPVLQKNCQVCHRTGGVAPMAFTTFESTRPWAKAIKAAVLNRKMPPWFADPHVGEFRNAPELTQADINTLTAWADGGRR